MKTFPVWKKFSPLIHSILPIPCKRAHLKNNYKILVVNRSFFLSILKPLLQFPPSHPSIKQIGELSSQPITAENISVRTYYFLFAFSLYSSHISVQFRWLQRINIIKISNNNNKKNGKRKRKNKSTAPIIMFAFVFSFLFRFHYLIHINRRALTVQPTNFRFSFVPWHSALKAHRQQTVRPVLSVCILATTAPGISPVLGIFLFASLSNPFNVLLLVFCGLYNWYTPLVLVGCYLF